MTSPRRNVVALRHVAFEDLGLLAPLLRSRGWDITLLDVPSADLTDAGIVASIEQADLLVVLGGPIGVGDADAYPFLTPELRLIERRLTQDRPLLGICLGSQLMAAALGSRVYPGGTKEIGWGQLQLTDAGTASCLAPLADPDAMVLHWHGDTFDLPTGAVRLASTPVTANQAFSLGANVLALQFHMEADPETLETWLIGHTGELGASKIDIPRLRAEIASTGLKVAKAGAKAFSLWLDGLKTA
jgi:GMP synthase (glutamine-hydrolysing)